jgi:hypothetical protein
MQTELEVATRIVENLPAAQLVQTESPVDAPYLPAAQSEQTEDPAAEYLPATQSVHTKAPAPEYLPATQSVQTTPVLVQSQFPYFPVISVISCVVGHQGLPALFTFVQV